MRYFTFSFLFCVLILCSGWKASDPAFDSVSGAHHTISQSHYKVHQQQHFYICKNLTKQLGEKVELIAEVPEGCKPNLTIQVSSNGGLTYNLYEGVQGISGGDNLTAFNNNRNSTNTSDVIWKSGASYTSNGTVIYNAHAGADKTAGSSAFDREIILKSGTNYLFEATSDVNDNEISYCVDYYE